MTEYASWICSVCRRDVSQESATLMWNHLHDSTRMCRRADAKRFTGFTDIDGRNIYEGDILLPTKDFQGNPNPDFVLSVVWQETDKRWETFSDHYEGLEWSLQAFRPRLKS